MSEGDSRRWLLAVALLAAVATAMRVHNAYHFGIGWGYDSVFHWAYVRRLLIRGFHLPDPESGWSMSRPPLFFFAAAGFLKALGLNGQGDEGVYRAVVAVRLASSAVGLGAIALILGLVRRLAPGDGLRLTIAAGLLLLLPVHLYMSAMFNEEILLGALITLALCLTAWQLLEPKLGGRGLARVAAIGVLAGLAAMTKLTGVLVAAAACLALLVDGWRRGEVRRALLYASIIGLLAASIGGWFYARNLIVYGYIWPHSLGVHQIMLDMPPGERGLLDYVYIPFSTFFDARAIQRDLQHSVWGTTYASFWYDSHRHFVPPLHTRAKTMGAVILLLALVPTAAGVVGLTRGARRALWPAPRPLAAQAAGRVADALRTSAFDVLLVGITAITLVGYAAYTWKNPWYATVKSSYLLGLLLPFAFYTSEVLAEWIRAPSKAWVGRAVGAVLVALAICIVCAFTFETFLWDRLFGPVGFPNAPELPGPMQQ